MNDHFKDAFEAIVDWLEANVDDITGVVITSAKKTFFAGGDLNKLRTADPENSDAEAALTNHMKAVMRRLETLGKPVVAAINGAALGGGLEVALVTHHRIAAGGRLQPAGRIPRSLLRASCPAVAVSPEHVRMHGHPECTAEGHPAVDEVQARPKALKLGLIDELAPDRAELEDQVPRTGSRPTPTATQPWDVKGFRSPADHPPQPSLGAMLPALPALLRRQTKGAPMPAPRAAIRCRRRGCLRRHRHSTGSRNPLLRPPHPHSGGEEHDQGVLLRPRTHQLRRLTTRWLSNRAR